METLTRVRRMLAAIFLCGSLGTGAELILLEHTEDVWQISPLALIAVGCITWWGVVLRPRPAGVRFFQIVMVLFVTSGVVGVLLHYQGNVEFEQELRPGIGGFELFWAAMKGATPALAPGTMMLLGALGLACTYGHPVLRQPKELVPASVEE